MIDIDAIARDIAPGAQRTFNESELRAIVTELGAARTLAEQAARHRAAWAKRSCGCGVCWALGNYEAVVRNNERR